MPQSVEFTGPSNSGAVPSTVISGLSSRQVLFGSSVGGIQQNAGFVFDSTSLELTITSPDMSAFTALSGNATDFVRIAIGRTVVEGVIGMSAAPTEFFSQASAGDIAIRVDSSAQKLLLGVGTTAQVVIDSTNVSIPANVRVADSTAFTFSAFGVAGATQASTYTTAAATTARTFATTVGATTANASTFTGVSGAGCAWSNRANFEAWLTEYNALVRVVQTMYKDMVDYGWLR